MEKNECGKEKIKEIKNKKEFDRDVVEIKTFVESQPRGDPFI